jgi:hypothetical protein
MRAARVATLLLLLLGLACAKRPVLYPNEHLEEVGAEASQRDIDDCIALAEAADLDTNQAAEAAKKTGTGAAVGTATGAVGGAISGRPGTGALVGLGVGSVGGFFSWLFGSGEPDPVFVRYVDTCLAERGYQPIGWK